MSPRVERHADLGRWTVLCCGRSWVFANPLSRDESLVNPLGRRLARFGDERTAVQFLVEHLRTAHGVAAVEMVVVSDVRFCTGPAGLGCEAMWIFDPDPPCPVCDNTERVSTPRPVGPDGSALPAEDFDRFHRRALLLDEAELDVEEVGCDA